MSKNKKWATVQVRRLVFPCFDFPFPLYFPATVILLPFDPSPQVCERVFQLRLCFILVQIRAGVYRPRIFGGNFRKTFLSFGIDPGEALSRNENSLFIGHGADFVCFVMRRSWSPTQVECATEFVKRTSPPSLESKVVVLACWHNLRKRVRGWEDLTFSGPRHGQIHVLRLKRSFNILLMY